MIKRSHSVTQLSPSPSGWNIKCYLILAKVSEIVDLQMAGDAVCRILAEIVQGCDAAYTLERRGFVIIHFGNRGICFSVWHWGRWGETKELFSYAWYVIGRDYQTLQMLQRTDPVCCWHELDIVAAEMRNEL